MRIDHPKAVRARRVVAQEFGSSEELMLGKRRSKPVALARHAAMWVLWTITPRPEPYRHGWSERNIGVAFNRERTTARYGIGRIEKLRQTDAAFSATLDKCVNLAQGDRATTRRN